MPTISKGRVTSGTGSVVFVPASSGGGSTGIPPSGAPTGAISTGLTGTSAAGLRGPTGPTGPAGGGGIVAPSFSIIGNWEPSQQIVAVSQFNMVFDGVQTIGSNDSYLQIFGYTEGISD